MYENNYSTVLQISQFQNVYVIMNDISQFHALWVETEDLLECLHQAVLMTILLPELPFLITEDIPRQEQDELETSNIHSASTNALAAGQMAAGQMAAGQMAAGQISAAQMAALEDSRLLGSDNDNNTTEEEPIEFISKINSMLRKVHLAFVEVDDLDREIRETNLFFVGLGINEFPQSSPKRDEISLCSEAVIHFCNYVLNLPVTASAIASAFRMPHFKSHNANPPIIVTFSSKLIRDEVYRSGIMLEAYNESKPVEEQIYLREDLTRRNQQIQKAVRKAVKSGKLADTWTDNGYVFFKCNRGDVHLAEHVFELCDLANFLRLYD